MATDDPKQQYRGMSAEQVEGQKQQQEEPSQEGGQQKQQQQSSQQQEPNQNNQNQPQGQQSSGEDLSQYKNILTKTFGYTEDEITDKDLKVAKSYANLQSKTTKIQDEFQTLRKQFEQQQNGNTQENSKNKEPDNSGEPSKKGDNSGVDEKTLFNEGYLKQGDLDGLSDLERQRTILHAESEYLTDKAVKDYEERIKKVEEQREQEKTKEQIKQENTKRFEQDVDNLVKQGVTISELREDQWEQLKTQMLNIRDPKDSRYIASNALQVAAYMQGLVTPQNNNQQPESSGLQDSGFSANKKQDTSNNSKSLNEQLSERAKSRYFNGNSDPKASFRQK